MANRTKVKVSPRGMKQNQEIQDSEGIMLPLNLKKGKNKVKMTIQVLIYNCRRLRKKVSTFLKNLIQENHFHFIGLEETIIENCDDSLLRRFEINQDFFWEWNPSQEKLGDILVGIRKYLHDVVSFKQGEFMQHMVLWDKSNKIKWILLIVYGATLEEKRMLS